MMADALVSPAVLGLVVAVTLIYLPMLPRKGEKKLLKLLIIGDLYSLPVKKPLLRWDVWAKERGEIATSKPFGIIRQSSLTMYFRPRYMQKTQLCPKHSGPRGYDFIKEPYSYVCYCLRARRASGVVFVPYTQGSK
jgi:hypothetical protein